MLTDEGVLRFTRVPEPVPPDFAGTWFAFYNDGRHDGTREAFAIVEGRDSRFLALGLARPASTVRSKRWSSATSSL